MPAIPAPGTITMLAAPAPRIVICPFLRHSQCCQCAQIWPWGSVSCHRFFSTEHRQTLQGSEGTLALASRGRLDTF